MGAGTATGRPVPRLAPSPGALAVPVAGPGARITVHWHATGSGHRHGHGDRDRDISNFYLFLPWTNCSWHAHFGSWRGQVVRGMYKVLHAMNQLIRSWHGQKGHGSCHEQSAFTAGTITVHGCYKDSSCPWHGQMLRAMNRKVPYIAGTRRKLFMPRTNRRAWQGRALFMAGTRMPWVHGMDARLQLLLAMNHFSVHGMDKSRISACRVPIDTVVPSANSS